MKNNYLTLNIPEHLVKEWFRSVGAEIVVLCKDCYWRSQCRFEQELGMNGFCSKGARKGEVREK